MRLLAIALLSAIAMCAHADERTVPAASASPPGAAYGEAFADGPVVPLSVAISAFDDHAGQPRRYSGRITGVCQAKGCWMMLEDNGEVARVMFGDHAFYLPKDATGTAVVHGVLERKELTPAQVEHLGADSGKGVAAEPVEYRIVADGVRVAGAP